MLKNVTEILNEMCPFVDSNPNENWEKAKLVFSHLKQIASKTNPKDSFFNANFYSKISKYEKHVNQNYHEA
jgi:hypothetical protein